MQISPFKNSLYETKINLKVYCLANYSLWPFKWQDTNCTKQGSRRREAENQNAAIYFKNRTGCDVVFQPLHTTGKQLLYKSEWSHGIALGLCNSSISTLKRCRHTQAHAAFSSSRPKATRAQGHGHTCVGVTIRQKLRCILLKPINNIFLQF